MARLGGVRFAVVVVAAVAMLGAVRGEECKGDRKGLTVNCASYVGKPGPMVDPSKACCDVIKETDVACICQHITKAMDMFLNMEKVVHVAQFATRLFLRVPNVAVTMSHRAFEHACKSINI